MANDDDFNPAFDGRITVTILDVLTGASGLDSAHSPYYWTEGNGSCDCNRLILGFPEIADKEEERAAREHPESSSPLCGEIRFLITDALGDLAGYELWEFNQGYPPELVRERAPEAWASFVASSYQRENRPAEWMALTEV